MINPSKRFTFSSTQDGLSLTAYRGDGAVLLAFDLDEKLAPGLAGFAIYCTMPDGHSFYVPNRLSFSTGLTAGTTPEQRTWTPSDHAPMQKFSWLDFPSDVMPGAYVYQVTALYFDASGGLKTGPKATVSLELAPVVDGGLEFGFTRGYASSQAYAARFHNANIRPQPKTLDFDTRPYQAQYEWLGYHARQLVFDFLQECLADPSITVDLFAYDLDEPDFIRGLQQLGGRLRAVLDDAPLHTKPGALEPLARACLEASAGAGNIKVGHFKRFAHNKVLIQKKNGQPVKVLTGSANFSVRGLYVQANNILVFDDPPTAPSMNRPLIKLSPTWPASSTRKSPGNGSMLLSRASRLAGLVFPHTQPLPSPWTGCPRLSGRPIARSSSL